MRSDEAIRSASAPSPPRDFGGVEAGFNAISVNSGATLTGNWLDVRGYRRIGVAIQAGRNFSFFLLGQVGGLQSTANQRYQTTALTSAGSAGNIYTFTMDVCNDAVAIMISNTDSAAGAFTVTMTALP